MLRFSLALLLAASAASATDPSFAQTGRDDRPNAFVLTVKTGELRLAEGLQTISGIDRRFETTADTVFAIEGETRLDREENLSFGGEILHYRNHFARTTSTGPGFEDTMYTYGFLAKSKYYFRPGEVLQPYLGGGIGTVWSHDFSGPINGFANGLGYQAVAGLQLRADRVGMRFEYMYLRGRGTDGDGEKIRSSSYGVMFGMAFFLGRR